MNNIMRQKFTIYPEHKNKEIEGIPSIFRPEDKNNPDISELRKIAYEAIKGYTGIDLYRNGKFVREFSIIVTICFEEVIPLTMWYFDKAKNSYVEQVIIDDNGVDVLRKKKEFILE